MKLTTNGKIWVNDRFKGKKKRKKIENIFFRAIAFLLTIFDSVSCLIQKYQYTNIYSDKIIVMEMYICVHMHH